MSRAIGLLLLIVAFVTINADPHKLCGPNEEFNECGSSCLPTCEDPNPTVCTLACEIGCQCKEGYLKTASGNCVSTQDCPVS